MYLLGELFSGPGGGSPAALLNQILASLILKLNMPGQMTMMRIPVRPIGKIFVRMLRTALFAEMCVIWI